MVFSMDERMRVMTGEAAFMSLLEKLTITDVLIWIAAIGYAISQSKKIYEWIRSIIHKSDETGEAIDNAKNLSSYHKQSIEIRDGLRKDINMIKETVENITHRLDAMEERSRKKEVNKLRNTIIQSYQYYTSPEKNPLKAWTAMEKEAFWAIFRDYEDAGGDGYIHSEVEPAMAALRVVAMSDAAGIKELMESRK